MRPLLKKPKVETKPKMFSMKLEHELHQRLVKQCKRLGCQRSTIARMALVKILEELERETENNHK